VIGVDGNGTETNTYDAFGRLASRTNSSGTYEYPYDLGGNIVSTGRWPTLSKRRDKPDFSVPNPFALFVEGWESAPECCGLQCADADVIRSV